MTLTGSIIFSPRILGDSAGLETVAWVMGASLAPVLGVRSHLPELLQLGAKKAACQEGHRLRRVSGLTALLSLRLETRGWYLT